MKGYVMRGYIKLNGLVVVKERNQFQVGLYAPTPQLEVALQRGIEQAAFWNRLSRDQVSRGYPPFLEQNII